MLDVPLGPDASLVELPACLIFIFIAAASDCESDFGASLRSESCSEFSMMNRGGEDDARLVKAGAASRDIGVELDWAKQVTRTKQRVRAEMIMECIFLRKEMCLNAVI